MVRRGYQIAEKRNTLSPILQQDQLVALGMTIGDLYLDTRHHLGVSVQEAQLSTLLQGQEVILVVGGYGPLIGLSGLFPGSTLDVIGGIGERGYGDAGAVKPGSTAAVVKIARTNAGQAMG